MADPLTPLQQLDIIRDDQRHRWQRGERISCTQYLDQYPALASDTDCALQVIYQEVLLREESGETPGAEEYARQYPQWATQLERLFEVHRAVHSKHLFDTSRVEGASQVGHRTSRSPVSSHLPNLPGYQIVCELGRGGMGVVYQARDLALKRLVAIKMILAGPYLGSELASRFRAEAEAVARLQHPNIVQIHEIGETEGETGVACPFMALEYVEGGNLAERLAGKPQPHRAAAQLVETLARAVHYAHERGVVHRDLKPANILLAQSGVVSGGVVSSKESLTVHHSPLTTHQPKIADFGLAKHLHSQSGLTTGTAILGTPSYMAPEQAGGRTEAIGPAADVYALGAILYELFTGRPPFLGATSLDTLNQVQFDDPVPPRRLQPKLPRDLETICLKCLDKAPRKRYGSAAALADDLHRFLAGEPIQARPLGAFGRGYRWARRKPAAAALVAVIAIALIALIGGGAWYVTQVKAARDVAEAERQRARDHLRRVRQTVQDLLIDVSRHELSREPHMEQLRQSLLQRAVAICEELVREESNDPELRHDQALAHKHLAELLALLRTDDRAARECSQAIGLLRELASIDPANTAYRRDLAESLWRHAEILLLQKHQDAAERASRESVTILDAIVKERPEETALQGDLAEAYYKRAIVLTHLNLRGDAETAYREARQWREPLARTGEAEHRFKLAQILNNAANLAETDPARFRQAWSDKLEAVRILNELAHKPAARPEYWRDLANSCHDLARHLQQSERLDEAAERYRQAREASERLAQDFAAIPRYRWQLANARFGEATIWASKGSIGEAERAFDDAIRLSSRLVDESPSEPEYWRVLARSRTQLGRLLIPIDAKEEKLRQLADEAVALLEKRVGNDAHRDDRDLFAQALVLRLHAWAERITPNKVEDKLVEDFRRADQLLTGLIRESDQADYRRLRAMARLYRGYRLYKLSRKADAATAYREGIKDVEPLTDSHREVAEYHHLLALLLWNLALLRPDPVPLPEAALLLVRAVGHQHQAILLDASAAKYRQTLLRRQLGQRAQVGLEMKDHAEVARLSAELPRLLPEDWRAHDWAAVYLMRCLPSVEQDAKLSDAERCFVKCSYSDRALELAAKAQALAKSENHNYWPHLGWVHYQLGDWNQTIDAHKRSIETDGGTAHDRFYLAMAYHQSGNRGKSREWFDKGVQWMRDHPTSQPEHFARLRDEAEALLTTSIPPPGSDK